MGQAELLPRWHQAHSAATGGSAEYGVPAIVV
jgi:hypothetical protein